MDDKQKEFREAAKPMVDFLRKHSNPHCTVTITQTDAELYEGKMCKLFYEGEENSIHDPCYVAGEGL